MVRKVREFKKELIQLGFAKLPKRGKGSHERWRHAAGITIQISGHDNDDVHHYNEDQLKEARRMLADRNE